MTDETKETVGALIELTVILTLLTPIAGFVVLGTLAIIHAAA